MLEIRLVTAKLVTLFDVELAPGENGGHLLNQTSDSFTLRLDGLDMCFTPRKSQTS